MDGAGSVPLAAGQRLCLAVGCVPAVLALAVWGSHVEGVPGQRYRLHFSRASRIVWRLERAHP